MIDTNAARPRLGLAACRSIFVYDYVNKNNEIKSCIQTGPAAHLTSESRDNGGRQTWSEYID
jgi:hypothetical protein